MPKPRLYALCWCRWRNAFMSVQITIRGVPDEVRNELAARAAMQRQSMQEFLLGELERIACRPTVDAWLRGVRDRKEISAAEVGAAAILRERDADRRAGAFETCSSDEFFARRSRTPAPLTRSPGGARPR